MMLTDQHADQIRALLKERNQLTREYSRIEVQAANYFCRFVKNEVIAFVELKKVQWYQAEVCHLTVHQDHERRGHAKSLVKEVEQAAACGNSRVLQCTIREDNVSSLALFQYFGFALVSRFYNRLSGNNVNVLQKVIELPR